MTQKISIQPIKNTTMINHHPTKRDRFIASMCHLSPVIPLVLIILCSLTGIGDAWIGVLFFSRLVLPIICWHIGRNNPWIIHHAKISFNFQMTQTFILLIPLLICGVLLSANLEEVSPVFLLIILLSLVIQIALIFIHFMLAGKASMMATNNIDETGKLIYPLNYPLTISFFKNPQTSRHFMELPEKNLLLITQDNNSSNDTKSGVKLILAIPMSLGIWFVCFSVSLIVGKGMAGPEIYDYEYDPEGAWRHSNDDLGIIAMTISHLFF
jgi:uncharacterized Tic20 family protein